MTPFGEPVAEQALVKTALFYVVPTAFHVGPNSAIETARTAALRQVEVPASTNPVVGSIRSPSAPPEPFRSETFRPS